MMFVRVNPGLITPYAVEWGGYHFSSHKNHWGNQREFTKVMVSCSFVNVGKTMPCLSPTGNGKHATFKSGDDWGMVYDCFTHNFTD